MPVFTDQLNRSILLSQPPQKIISLVPSQTELLYDLGLDDEIAGITKFCVHPHHWFQNKPKVGGTKKLQMRLLHDIHPDLIIANKEENNQEQIEELAKYYPVWISDVATLDDAMKMIGSIGELTGKTERATEIAETIRTRFRGLSVNPPAVASHTAYLIWRNPYMAVGGDTFVNDMLKYCGLRNIFENVPRYPCISIEDLRSKNCSLLLLSSEPFPFGQKHVRELHIHLPETSIVLADGEMFSWYGSRLLQAPGYFRNLLEHIQQ